MRVWITDGKSAIDALSPQVPADLTGYIIVGLYSPSDSWPMLCPIRKDMACNYDYLLVSSGRYGLVKDTLKQWFERLHDVDWQPSLPRTDPRLA